MSFYNQSVYADHTEPILPTPTIGMIGLIEDVTGLAYHEAIRDRVIDPLDLDNTYLAGYEDGPAVFGGYFPGLNSVEPLTFDFTSIATIAWASGVATPLASGVEPRGCQGLQRTGMQSEVYR